MEAAFSSHMENCKKIKQKEKKLGLGGGAGVKRKKMDKDPVNAVVSNDSKRAVPKKVKITKAPLPLGSSSHINFL